MAGRANGDKTVTITTFKDLKLGQLFVTKGSEEFGLIKLRNNRARVIDNGITTSVKDDELVEPIGPEPVLHDTPTEIERAALSLLLQDFGPFHTAMNMWVNAMASNPNEFRWLDAYVIDPTVTLEDGDGNTYQLADWCRKVRKYITPTKEWDRDNNMGKAIQDCEPTGKELTGDERHIAERNRIAYHLAMAVREYREMGRPDGDQTHTIMGMNSPLMTVTTSLAAAVVEYHQAIVNQICYEHMDNR